LGIGDALEPELNATYRLQLAPPFGFREVQALVPYLQRLGISHLYLSPVTEAPEGSSHGYDVVDHNKLREELGGEEGFESLREACVAARMGLLLDFVPNHAGVGPENIYWQDVLTYGPHSVHARFFDVDWEPLKPELRQKMLLPFLGRPYGQALDAGEIGMVWEDHRLSASYFDHRFALRPESYVAVLEALLPTLERTDSYWEAKELLEAYQTVTAEERERSEALRGRFAVLANHVDIHEILDQFRAKALHGLLELQFWRLSYWKTAGDEINYRRFFDINGLVALRMEEPEVFFDAHRLLADLLRRDGVHGVRIDHVDGLYDPHSYLERLREIGARHIWVEKILVPGETLPAEWPVEGTTGYEFLNDVLRLFNRPEGEAPLKRIYRRVVADPMPYADIVHRSKRLVIATKLSAELHRLSYELDRLSESDYRTRDFTMGALQGALVEVVAALRRYRTYLPHQVEEAAREIKAAVHAGQRRNPAFEPLAYSFIQEVLLYAIPEDLTERRRAWVGRFQQYTAPVAAKGVEDTAFYRYVSMVALNEVGGDPDRFADGPEVFHARARYRALKYPNTLLATATHDHKRGEDTRMRLLVLSEAPDLWRRTVVSLERAARRHGGPRGPSTADKYLFYQTLVAVWGSDPPDQLEARLVEYMEKAAREAKVNTSWLNPRPGYEANLRKFVEGMVRDRWVARAVQPLVQVLKRRGFTNTVAQLILKLCSPGVPDFYQGSELLDLSLVDPDNRRAVDFGLRLRVLNEIEPHLAQPRLDTLREWHERCDARLKFYTMVRLLRFRANHRSLHTANYQAIEPKGDGGAHVVVFARQWEGGTVVVVVPRFSAWRETTPGVDETLVELPAAGSWLDVLSGVRLETDGRLALGQMPLPWAVLSQGRAGGALA